MLAWMLLVQAAPAMAQDVVDDQSLRITAPDAPISGERIDLKISAPEGVCPQGKTLVTIAKEKHAFPLLFVSYLPKGELLRATVEFQDDRAALSYLFWDEGSYRIRARADCGAGLMEANRLMAVGTPPAKAGRTAILLAAILISGLLSGYLVSGMRRSGR